MLVSLVFVILALVEFAFVALLSRRNKPNEDSPNGDKVREAMLGSSQTRAMPDEQTFNGWVKEFGKLQYLKKVKPFSKMPSIHIIDFISFLLFTFLYVLFNGIYWMSY